MDNILLWIISFIKSFDKREGCLIFRYIYGGGQGEAGEAILCPKCKTAHVNIFQKVVKCSDANCGLLIFSNMSEKYLSDKQIMDLLTSGKTSVIKGFNPTCHLFPLKLPKIWNGGIV